MKAVRLALSCLLPLLAACNDKASKPAAPAAAAADPHEEVIREFQSGQQRFKELVAGIRDEKTLDDAMPALDKIVADWKQVTEKMRKLEAPAAEAEKQRYRKMISDGHRSSEPIAKDMLRLVMMENRGEQLGKYLKSLTDAGGAAGWEMTRLYGMTDYSRDAAASPEMQFKREPSAAPTDGEAPGFGLGRFGKLHPEPAPTPERGKKADEE